MGNTFTRKSAAKIEPTSVATADVYPTECNEGVAAAPRRMPLGVDALRRGFYPEERSEDVVPERVVGVAPPDHL